MKDEMRHIDGWVTLSKDGEGICRKQLLMYGGLDYLFVELPYRTMESHLSKEGILGMDATWRWSDLELGEAYRLKDGNGSVVSVHDVARETAKRLLA